MNRETIRRHRSVLGTAPLALALLAGCSDPWGPGLEIRINQPPPAGATADEGYIIEWTLSVRDHRPNGIDLFVDTDLDPEQGLVQIAESLSVESTGFLWDCSLFPEGDYYVRALLYEGAYTESDYSEGTISVRHGDRASP